MTTEPRPKKTSIDVDLKPLIPPGYVKAAGVVLVLFILWGLLTPATYHGPPSKRSHASNQLKQIGLAFDGYQDGWGRLPARAIYDPSGKPLLSWRVAILPFVEGSELYKQFHLDEPWDSPHNLALVEQMPEVYKNPESTSAIETHYLAADGPECFFGGENSGVTTEILDGADETILVVEADRAVVWTKPEDLHYTASDPKKDLRTHRPRGFMALLADGSAHYIKHETEDDTVSGLMTTEGGEDVRAALKE